MSERTASRLRMARVTAKERINARRTPYHHGIWLRNRPWRMVFTTDACVPTFTYWPTNGLTPISVVEVAVTPMTQNAPGKVCGQDLTGLHQVVIDAAGIVEDFGNFLPHRLRVGAVIL